MDSKENKNKKISAAVAVSLHAVLLFVFFLMLAWVEPDPPIPEYGIELNFDTAPVENTQNGEEASVQSEQENEPVESEESEIEPSASEEQTAAPESEQQEESEVETETQESAETEDINSPDVVQPTPVEEVAQTESVIADQGEDMETSESSASAQEEDTPPTEEVKPVLDERAIFKKSDAGTSAEAKGSSLELAGWNWDFLPEPDDRSSENGKIVFQITIDNEGEIIRIKTLEKTVSPVVEKVYRDAVMDLTFSKTADNKVAAASSTGKITFIIKSK